MVDLSHRADELLALFKTYAKVRKKSAEEFCLQYGNSLSKLSPDAFTGLKSRLQLAVLQSKNLEQRAKSNDAAYMHSGHLFNQFKELLNSELHRFDILISNDDE